MESQFNTTGGIHAGRDNVFNVVGEQQTYKSIDQQNPNELRSEYAHSQKVSKYYRFETIKKTKYLLFFLLFGLCLLGVMAFFVNELSISFADGGARTVKIWMSFIWSVLNEADQVTYLASLFGFMAFMIFCVILPMRRLIDVCFSDDEFLMDEKNKRKRIRKRLLSLGEKL